MAFDRLCRGKTVYMTVYLASNTRKYQQISKYSETEMMPPAHVHMSTRTGPKRRPLFFLLGKLASERILSSQVSPEIDG